MQFLGVDGTIYYFYSIFAKPQIPFLGVNGTIYHAVTVRDYIAGWVRKQRTVTVAKCGEISHRIKLFGLP